MNSPSEPFDELPTLCEAAVEDRLTDKQRRRLEQLVLENVEARRYYVEYLHQHACLHWSAAEPAAMPTLPVAVTRPHALAGSRRSLPRWLRRSVAVAAAILVAVGAWLAFRPSAPHIATLAESKACKWDGGSLPTEPGARLAAGRLRLAEGLARIVFDSGAEVQLEAPAELELVSAKRCVLHAGR